MNALLHSKTNKTSFFWLIWMMERRRRRRKKKKKIHPDLLCSVLFCSVLHTNNNCKSVLCSTVTTKLPSWLIWMRERRRRRKKKIHPNLLCSVFCSVLFCYVMLCYVMLCYVMCSTPTTKLPSWLIWMRERRKKKKKKIHPDLPCSVLFCSVPPNQQQL